MSRGNDKVKFSISARELLKGVPAWECHLHSLFTDGTATIAAIAQRAHEKGLSRIIFTEHTESWKAARQNWFDDYRKEVAAAAEQFAGRLEVVLGIEAPAADFGTKLELSAEMKDATHFILGAAHRYPGLNNRRVQDLSPEECIDLEYKTLLALARNPHINAIAHLGGTCRQYCCDFPLDLAAEVVRTARDNGVAIELNSRYHNPMLPLLEICLYENAEVIIGSDVHRLEEIGNAFETAKKCVENLTA